MRNPLAPASVLAERLADVPLLDHHCHGIVREAPDTDTVLDHLTEAPDRLAARTTPLESSLGIGVRAALGLVLGLEAPVRSEDYLTARAAYAPEDLFARSLATGGVRGLLVDTGFRSELVLEPAELEAASGVPALEVVRLEAIAERVLADLGATADFRAALEAAVARAARRAVAYKSVAAYRSGLDLPDRPPAPRALETALARILDERDRGHGVRVVDRDLVAAIVWAALEVAPLPLQFHVGIGDPDVRLARGHPGELQPFIEAIAPHGVRLVLLHTYPFHREAALLAHDYPHVFVDLGLAESFVGPAAPAVLAEMLELAPWGKLCYSSDAFGLPELYALGALGHRRAMAAYLEPLLAEGWIAEREAFRLARLVAYENALALYELPWPLPTT
ncbi:amidohydrolase 2 [Acidimicrobium ferrooxidans DSM 10331]|uniref:Amidohydrolase 2 n=1 Tax=Acidimicrobium ferrooxidans (strain DSM 10331 / JCM 15462 / NBRC 103882 / ICP) TaxID=525909 RepID=C7M1X2_ACIFD|nr:amidohydrolase family protein [Acidimicrobium ferrooxidans]ACU54869.1 amidohydrolase 2 [Acidimicrobium ferrooxidans DSM 10331]